MMKTQKQRASEMVSKLLKMQVRNFRGESTPGLKKLALQVIAMAAEMKKEVDPSLVTRVRNLK